MTTKTTDNLDELFIKYPHIANKINDLWGTAECRQLLVSLLADSRDGKRAGFPPSVASEIFKMLKQHDIQFPKFDTTDHIIVPFKSISTIRTAPVQSSNDWAFVKFAANVIVAVLVLALVYRVVKPFLA